jgi:predicted ATPase
MTVLEVTDFAQIQQARIEFGDLTVLVGPQASGKSLLLQWLKAAIDIGEIVFALKEAGDDVKTEQNLLDLTFGEGMSAAWKEGKTEVRFDGYLVSPRAWTRGLRKKSHGSVFFIPAHRALLLAEGWPAPFLKLNADTPVVARLFSQNLYQRFSGRQAAALFPVQRILKEQYRTLIDEAVFHGGKVELDKEGLRYRLRLTFNELSLPFMTWTAGQREFTPLLLGLYHVLPPRKFKKRKEVDWVVIEEPEMGLHPQAVAVVMLLVLDLLWRGYKVVISTHSPLVLDVVWAIRQLRQHSGRWQLLAHAFRGEETPSMRKVMEHALAAEYRVYFLDIDQDKHNVTTRDISELDPDAPEETEATWGGLTGFSSRFGEAVRGAVNEDEG